MAETRCRESCCRGVVLSWCRDDLFCGCGVAVAVGALPVAVSAVAVAMAGGVGLGLWYLGMWLLLVPVIACGCLFTVVHYGCCGVW